MEKHTVIAIDGPAASGKGTLARKIAAQYGFDYLDTGLLYRAVGWAVRGGADPVAAARALQPADLDNPALRGDDAANAASKISAIPEVRAALLDFQRDFAAHPPGGQGAVLDGRDIGTVICPDAPVKLFITASAGARAQRRFKELSATHPGITEAEVLADILERDARDSNRAVAPLKPAADALLLDTTNLSIEGAFEAAVSLVSDRLRGN